MSSDDAKDDLTIGPDDDDSQEFNLDLSISLHADDIKDLLEHLEDAEQLALEQRNAASLDLEDPMLGHKVGNCRIQKLIGKGGFGKVYKAKHLFLDEHFAVKVLAVSHIPDPQAILRFQREARALHMLDHEKIVRLLDFGIIPEVGLYLLMEYLKGRNLQVCLRENESFSISRLSGIFSQLCSALGYVHEAGIVHRDLKPSNIFLSKGPSAEQLKLIDFGIVTLQDGLGSITETGTYVGSARYAAPEQIMGDDKTDPRSDLYSTGILLYTLLTGGHPFGPAAAHQIMFHHINTPAPTLASRAPHVEWAEELEMFMRVALAKEPEERPTDAQLFWELLEEALHAQQEHMPLPVNSPKSARPQPRSAPGQERPDPQADDPQTADYAAAPKDSHWFEPLEEVAREEGDDTLRGLQAPTAQPATALPHDEHAPELPEIDQDTIHEMMDGELGQFDVIDTLITRPSDAEQRDEPPQAHAKEPAPEAPAHDRSWFDDLEDIPDSSAGEAPLVVEDLSPPPQEQPLEAQSPAAKGSHDAKSRGFPLPLIALLLLGLLSLVLGGMSLFGLLP